MNKLDNSNYVEYRLSSASFGEEVIQEPINYDDGNQNIYERDKKSKGFLTKKSNSLEFHNDGYTFLLRQVGSKGIKEDVLITKWIKDDTRLDERWRIATKNYLDLATLTFDQSKTGKGIAKAKVSEGGLKKIIDSKVSEKLDLTITQALNGEQISPLLTQSISLEPRKIFLKSILEVTDGYLTKAIVGDRLNARAIKFEYKTNSDQENITTVIDPSLNAVNNFYAGLVQGKEGNLFYTRADRTRDITLNGRIEIRIVNPNIGSLRIDLVKYFDDGSNKFAYLETVNGDATPLAVGNPAILGEVISVDINNLEVRVEEGESLTFAVLTDSFDGVWWETYDTYLEITEDSSFPATNARALTYFDIITRLLYLITGTPDLLVSELLSTGETGGIHEDLVSSGFWIREFPDIVNVGTDEERRVQYQTSLKDIIQHINLKEPVAWWVETIGETEYMRVESLKYTQQNILGVRFANTTKNIITGATEIVYSEAGDVTRKVLKDNFYGTIEMGSSKGGDGYEEVFGLTSIGGKATWGTINTNSESKYSVLSPYRLSDIDVELARRKPWSLYPDTDTKYDSDLIVIDAIDYGAYWGLKRWDFTYEVEPTGVYAVESAYNLEHTPARFLLKHSFIINSGLYHYPDNSVYFESSNCNSRFISKKVDEIEIKEDGPIPHYLFEAPRIKPFSVSLTLKVTQEIEDNILGSQSGVDNWFGLVAVKIRDTIQYFRLYKTDANKEGKHELVEANII